MSSPIPTANKNSGEPSKQPLGMPKYIAGKDGVLYPIRTKLDPDRCWMLLRRASGEVGIWEMILTPACLSLDPKDEDAYLAFLNQHGGWEMMKVIPSRQTKTGRDEFYWVNSPNDLTDTVKVLDAIRETMFSTPQGGKEEYDHLEQRFRLGRLRMSFKL